MSLRTLLTGLGLATTLFAAAPASAQAFRDWEGGPWEVYGDGSDCWMVYRPDDANELSVAIASGDTDFYIGVKMSGTAFAVARQSYPITVGLGGQVFATNGYGMKDGGRLGTILDEPSPQVMPVFRRADRITYTVRGAAFDVLIEPGAKNQFLACEASIGGAGSAPAKH